MVTTLLTCPVLLCLPTCFYSGSAWGLPLGQWGAQLPTVSRRGSQPQLGECSPYSTQAPSHTPCDSHPCGGGNGPSGPAHVLSPRPSGTALPRPMSHELPVLFPIWKPMAGLSLTGF